MRIDKNIPIPASVRLPRRKKTKADIVASMEPGDSIECKSLNQATYVYQVIRKLGHTSVMRRLNKTTWRVWRKPEPRIVTAADVTALIHEQGAIRKLGSFL